MGRKKIIKDKQLTTIYQKKSLEKNMKRVSSRNNLFNWEQAPQKMASAMMLEMSLVSLSEISVHFKVCDFKRIEQEGNACCC